MSKIRKLALGAVALLAAGVAVAQPASATPAKNIVLVHGAFADGSGWRGVYDILKKDGYHVSIVQEPLTSLADDIAATKHVLDQQTGPVVLVGHSYAGGVISVAGADPKVQSLVYIAGFMPETGETMGQLVSKFPSANDAVQPAGEGYLQLDPAKFVATFAADVPPALAGFMAVSQRPVAAAGFGATVTGAAWKTKPSYAILTLKDHALNPDLQRWMYKRAGARVTELASSHVGFISHPVEVAKVIETAAQ